MKELEKIGGLEPIEITDSGKIYFLLRRIEKLERRAVILEKKVYRLATYLAIIFLVLFIVIVLN